MQETRKVKGFWNVIIFPERVGRTWVEGQMDVRKGSKERAERSEKKGAILGNKSGP